MTPQERQQIAELFDRLASLEGKPRDPEAERAIAQELGRAPHALYPLVQTVLVQDEALRAADARIRALEGEGEAPQQGGFLESMRDSVWGRRDQQRGSVPSVRSDSSGFRNAPGYRPMEQQPPQTQQPPVPQQGGFGGGSFLGTAAAGAAGVIGGALLLNSFRGMMGGGDQKQGEKHSALDQSGGNADRSPWGGDAAGSDLARDAGAGDIGRGGPLASADGGDRRAGLFDTAQNDGGSDDSGFDGGGDSDTA